MMDDKPCILCQCAINYAGETARLLSVWQRKQTESETGTSENIQIGPTCL